MKGANLDDSKDQALEKIQRLTEAIQQQCDAQDFEAAIRLLMEQATILEALGDKLALGNNYEQQADIEDNHTYDLERSGWLREKAEILKFEAGDKATIAARLGAYAMMQKLSGKKEAAQEILKQQELYLRELNNHLGLVPCLKDQAELLFETGYNALALKLIVEAEQLIYQYGVGHETIRLCNLLTFKAKILEEEEDLEGALAVLKEAQPLAKASTSRSLAAENLADQAMLYYKLGQTAMAIELFSQSAADFSTIKMDYMLPEILDRHAQMRLEIGDLEAALNLQCECEKVALKWEDTFQVKRSLYAQAQICLRMGNRDQASELVQKGRAYTGMRMLSLESEKLLRNRFPELL